MAKIKKIAALLTATLLCGSVLFTVACGGDKKDPNTSQPSTDSSDIVTPSEPSVFALEEHTWTDWETVTEKTCTKDGKEQLVCQDEGCGKIKTRTVKAGHVWGAWTGSTNGLCENNATLTRICAECNKTESQTIAARGHAYDGSSCKICNEPFVFPTLAENPAFVDVWGDSVNGSGSAFDRKELSVGTYYTMDVPVSDPEGDMDSFGVWISLPVDEPGQYALLTVGNANGVTIERFDASAYYIPGDDNGYIGYEAINDNGAAYSIVSCSELYWNVQWRATWRFSTANANAQVKFVILKVAPTEWTPLYIHETAIPSQINNVTANEIPDSYTAVAIDYNDEYYFDEWNEVYRRGTKSNPGEVIYLAIDTAATRLLGDKTFTTIQEDGNNLRFSIGKDEKGNYLLRDYQSFLLAEEAVNGNAYQNFVNSKGTYPVNQELYEFLQLYTEKNRPIDIPNSIWENEAERVKKAWLAPCYYYRELTPGTEDNPYLITQLGRFEASVAKFDITYFTIRHQDESGAPVSYLTLSCQDTNARISINGKTYVGPFSVKFETNSTIGTTFFIGAKNGAETTFTLTLSDAGEGAYSNPITISQAGETELTTKEHLAADGTLGYEAYYEYVVTKACTLTFATDENAYVLFGDAIAVDGIASLTITEDMLGENGYTVSLYVSTAQSGTIHATISES